MRILPNSIEIISFNGIDPSLKQSDFDKGIVRARRYRNRRIGEFLKELKLTEGKGTGIPTIRKALSTNQSPPIIFDTNEPERSYFICEIKIHSSFINESNQQSNQQSNQVTEEQKRIITFCKTPKSRKEILSFLGITNQTKNYKKYIEPLLKEDLIHHTKEIPTDRNQQYVITKKGEESLI